MGFSAALQGASSHAALVARQDAELRLLETMKRVVGLRAKCDRDYSLALTQLAQTTAKIDHSDGVLQNSTLLKVRTAIIASLHFTAEL